MNTKKFLIFSFICLIGFFLFHGVLHFYYVTYDDQSLIYGNPYYLNLKLKNILFFWTHFFENLYMPMTYSAWFLTTLSLRGADLSQSPQAFHLLSLVFCLLNAGLVYLLIEEYLERSTAALVGAFFFLLHPIHLEAVAWISAFKDVLATFFSLLTIIFYVRYQKQKRKDYLLPIFFFFLMALCSKISSVVLPVILFLFYPKKIKIPLIASLIALPFFIATTQSQPISLAPMSLMQKIYIALDSMSFYLYKLILPFGFTLNYGRVPEVALKSSLLFYGVLFYLLFLVLVWRKNIRNLFLIGSGIFFISLLPTSGFVPFFYQKYSTVSDRFAYFSILGPALFFSVLWEKASTRLLKAGFLFVLIFLSLLSYTELKNWRDDTTIVAQMARVAPDPEHSYNLAKMLLLEMNGMDPVPGLAKRPLYRPKNEKEHQIWLKVIELNYKKAIEQRFYFPEAHEALGRTLCEQGKLIEGIASFNTALYQRPNFHEAQLGLSKAYQLLGRKDLTSTTHQNL